MRAAPTRWHGVYVWCAVTIMAFTHATQAVRVPRQRATQTYAAPSAPPSGLQAASQVWANVKANSADPAQAFVLIFQGNHAFAPMLESWLCNTARMAGVHQRTLLVMTDEAGYRLMADNKYSVAVGLNDASDPTLQQDMTYGTAGYWKLTLARVNLLHQLLNAGISFMNWEPDAFWARNPLQDWTLLAPSTDIVIAPDGDDELAFGMMLMRANLRTRRVFHKLAHQLQRSLKILDGRSSADNITYSNDLQEQKQLKRLLQTGYANATYTLLSQCLYPTGKWYEVEAFEPRRRACIASHGPPIVINNNWIVGNDRKVERAMRWGHWFVGANGRCNERAVSDAIALHTLHPMQRVRDQRPRTS